MPDNDVAAVDRHVWQQTTERFFAACAGGDDATLMAALAPDVVLIRDGGGKATATLRPIGGARRPQPRQADRSRRGRRRARLGSAG